MITDPEFAAKFAQIRGAWQAILVQVVAGVVIVALVSAPAFKAHENKGSLGWFLPEVYGCQPSCEWFGRFVSDDGSSRNVFLGAGGPAVAAWTHVVRVIDSGDQFTVYPQGGGTDWQSQASALPAAIAVLCFVTAAEVGWPLYSFGRRRRRARAGLASLGIPPG